MYRICLLGGNGYVGTRLQQFLGNCKQKFHLTVVDRNEHCPSSVLESIHTLEYVDRVRMSISDYLKQVDLSSTFDCVVLLAGQCSVASSSDLLVTVQNNIVVFSQVVAQLEGTKCLFVYASSSSVYGNTDNQVVDENYSKYKPYNYYDLSKQTIDHIAGLVPGLRYFGLRFGTVNGVAPNHRNDLMINSMVNGAVSKGEIIVSNPHINRPILYIEDLCSAVYEILCADLGGRARLDGKYGVYNLVSFNRSVLYIAEEIKEVKSVQKSKRRK